MRYIFSASLLAIVMIVGQGCNNTSNTREAYIQPMPEPAPIEPVSVGIGALKYKKSCERGFARVEYVFEEDRGIDPLSFVFQHSIDGDSYDIDDGSSHSNGALVTVKDNVFIPANDTRHGIAHKVSVTYLHNGAYIVDDFSFIQPHCLVIIDDNDTVDINKTVKRDPQCSSCLY